MIFGKVGGEAIGRINRRQRGRNRITITRKQNTTGHQNRINRRDREAETVIDRRGSSKVIDNWETINRMTNKF